MKHDRKNIAQSDDEIVQNKFTAMITTSFDRHIMRYRQRQSRIEKTEISYDEIFGDDTEDYENIEGNLMNITYEFLDNSILYRALKKLKYPLAQIIYLHVIEERTFADIAAHLGMTVTSVTTYYSRAKKAIQEEVEKQNEFH